MIEGISLALMWLAGIVSIIGAAGMLRFPDFYTRSHAATMVSVGGFTLALMGIALQNLAGVYLFKILVVMIVNLITNPTATHALADAAYDVGIRPMKLVRNDLAKRKAMHTHKAAVRKGKGRHDVEGRGKGKLDAGGRRKG